MGAYVIARYRALSEKLFHPDLGAYESFAIVYEEREDNDHWRIAQKIPDVTDSPDAASKLVRLFNDGQLAPCHLMEVIENWLNL